MQKYTIIDLGGSLIMKDEVQTEFLRKFRAMLLRLIKNGFRFIVVSGGGRITRKYQEAASQIVHIPNEDLDWLGIHATRLNAHLLRTIFFKEAYPVIIDNLEKPVKGKPKLLIAAGTRPGWSTDYVAVMLSKRFGAERIVMAGTYDGVYDRDFEKYPDAKRIEKLGWTAYRNLIAKKWRPGYRAPIDPVAARAAQKFGIRADVVKAKDLVNFARCIQKKPFSGSIVA